MIDILGSVFGTLMAALFALGGPLLALHDRMPVARAVHPDQPLTDPADTPSSTAAADMNDTVRVPAGAA